VQDLRTRLTNLAGNFWWSWNNESDEIFRSIDEALWRTVNHNPIAFLKNVEDETLEECSKDTRILAHTNHAEKSLKEYLEDENHWGAWNAAGLRAKPLAYFSLEFCIHESLPIYSGGLGVLAGDFLKSCSDLGVPTVGIGLLYRQGYFIQEIDENGVQHEVYCDLDTSVVAVKQLRNDSGEIFTIEIPVGDELISVGVWRANVGRCALLLLDLLGPVVEAVPNSLRLYGGSERTRIIQEIILGVGGYRTLRELGVRPGVLHLNEGHSAFATLEAIAERMQETGWNFDQAAAEVAESVVFTTHTPVPAGQDRFKPDMILHYLRPLQKRLGLSEHQFLGLGRVDEDDATQDFCMTVLAFKLSRRANAVSSLHGGVSRKMWQPLWRDRRTVDVPIGHITNGVHVGTWQAKEMNFLLATCLGSDWEQHLCRASYWRDVDKLDSLNLWSVKVDLKRRLFQFIERRQRIRCDRLSDKACASIPRFDPDVLTIGFARRFATYKRALLLFEDMERAKRLLTNPLFPVQLIFAGKAHPADGPGKEFVRRLVEISKDPGLNGRVCVLENHDMNVSRHLIEGCDLWLNSPRRPLEACGTSGMKAVFNATLNCSVLDGWWGEAYDTRNGFAFGEGLVHVDWHTQDLRDMASLFDVLERQVIPLFYERDEQGVPVRWLNRVKHALKTLAWRYNSDRMVMDYVRQAYLDAANLRTSEIIPS